jgi:hypothetical protein
MFDYQDVNILGPASCGALLFGEERAEIWFILDALLITGSSRLVK